MPKFVMLAGISGAGKSEYAKHYMAEHPNCVLVSTDNIREEINGDAADQSNAPKVFELAQQRVRSGLKNGQTVLYDATNVSRKSRRTFLSAINHIPNVDKECHVILAPFGFACDNQMRRSRHVDFGIIQRQMGSFRMPDKTEGFSDIVYYNRYDYHRSKEDIIPRLDEIEQTGKWHVENVGTHCRMVNAAGKALGVNDRVAEAAEYHDIGKYYMNQNENGVMHFRNHENVSTYLYLCDKVHGFDVSDRSLYVARLIQEHDNVYKSGFSKERFAEAYGDEMLNDLQTLRKIDIMGMISPEQYKKMGLDQFLRTFDDWKQRLHNEPFSINMKEDGPYTLFKYNQFATDMNYRVSQECRGSIYKRNENGDMTCVCRPFDKFFNYGEENAASIDWSTARVTEKVDGSLHKVWFDDGQWHLSTNGTINAFDAPVGDKAMTFGEVFERALGADVATLGKYLRKDATYMFELTSPETQVVIPYQDGVYYLACRDTASGAEIMDKPMFGDDVKVKFPHEYKLTSLNDTLSVVQMMNKDEEGVVVNDDLGQRIKVKSPEYLVAAKATMKGQVTEKRIYQFIRDEKIDDFLGYAPEQKERVDAVRNKIRDFCWRADFAWTQAHASDYPDRKSFAAAVAKDPFRGYYFTKLDHPEATSQDYLFRLSDRSALSALGIEPNRPKEKNIHLEDRRLPDTSGIATEAVVESEFVTA